jgi:hypothetical protein
VQHAVACSACQDRSMPAEIFECTLGTCHTSYCDGCTSFRHCNNYCCQERVCGNCDTNELEGGYCSGRCAAKMLLDNC